MKNEVAMSTIKERDYLWDNIKALLIFFVVAGHVLEMNPVTCEFAMGADAFIYSFHMPAFIFASGYFSKNYSVDGKVRAEKAGTIFAYYIIFQGLMMILRAVFGIFPENLSMFNPCSGLWYLLALFGYYLITPIIEKLPAWLVIPASVLLALFIANDGAAGHYFTIMRAFTFAPYYFLGYYLSGNVIKKMRSLKAYIRYPLAAVCIAGSICSWALTPWISWMKLFFGKVNNVSLKTDFIDVSLCRLWAYGIALLMIAALILAMPDKKGIVAKVGQNSLQVYLLHMIIVLLLFVSDWVIIPIDTDLVFWLCMLGALATTIILSLWFFGYPFKWIQKGVHKLYSIKK